MPKHALLIFSGGQDSATCLAWALRKFHRVSALTFDYGQRHKTEIKSAQKIAKLKKIEHQIVKLDLFKKLTASALTKKSLKIEWKGKLPNTFVPGRNLIFLSVAAIIAYQKGIKDLIAGMCQTDFSGYPDCRHDFIRSMEKTLRYALDYEIRIHTPLMFLSKKQSIEMMQDCGECDLLRFTHTCYHGKRPACGRCPACQLRLKGFREAGLEDPLKYQK